MTTPTLKLNDTDSDLEAARLMRSGLPLAKIAARFDPPASIENANGAVRRGLHELNARAPKPVPGVPAREKPKATIPLEPDELLAWADTDGPARARRIATQVRGLLADLGALHERHAVTAQQRRIIAALEKQLADAKNELRQLEAAPRKAPVAAETSGASTSKDERARIRAWANENGYQVADRGYIATAVIDAYRAAHPGALS